MDQRELQEACRVIAYALGHSTSVQSAYVSPNDDGVIYVETHTRDRFLLSVSAPGKVDP